jgi:hypothetical protein
MKTTQLLPILALLTLAACSSTDCAGNAPTPTPRAVESEPAKEAPAAVRVAINHRELSAAAQADFQRAYGQALPAGDFWYDAKSGALGVMGQGIGGFLRPGHDFGTIPQNASNGNTGVIINGRDLPANEWLFLCQVLGGQVMPGRYWIDAYGNYGYEGLDLALGNLAANRGGAGGGSGWSKDNFWSGRFGTGNSNDDNSAGYVYIPGTGSVSYGL